MAFDRTLGGHDFDARLMEMLADMVNALVRLRLPRVGGTLSVMHQDGIEDDVREHKNAMGRLRLYSRRLKEVLSANVEGQAQVQCASLLPWHAFSRAAMLLG